MTEMSNMLKNSKIGYQYLIENILDVVAELDLDGTVIYVSPQFYDIFGYNPEEIIGNEFFKFIHPDYSSILKEQLKRGSKGKEELYVEFKVQHKSGNYIAASAKGTFIEINGETKLLGVLRDISKEKEAEEKLIQSEKKYKNLNAELEMIMDSVPGLIFYKDDRNNIIRVNKYFADAHETIKENLAGKNCFDIYPKDVAQKYLDDDLEVIKSNIPKLDFVEPWDVAEGRKWVSTSKIPLFNDEGECTGIIGFSTDITERKQAEQRLMKSEKKFRIAVENNPDYIVFLNKEGIILDVNRLEKGFTKDMVINQSVFNENFYETKDMCESARKAINDSITNKKTTSYEYSQTAPDGSISFYEAKASPFEYDIEGKIISLQLATRDITERRKIEQRLKESEQKYRLLAENARDVIWIMDMDFKFTYMSPSVKELRGYTAEEVMNQSLTELFTPKSMKVVEKTIEENLSPQKLKDRNYNGERNLELEHICKDGSTVWVEIKVSLLRDNTGKPIGILGISRDINERKKTELKLIESEEKFRTITEQSLIGIAILQDDRFSYVNKQLADNFGYTPEEMRNWEKLEYAKSIHPDDREMALEQARKKQLGLSGAVIHYQFRGITKKGEVKWLEIYSNTINYKGATADLITIIDITSKKDVEQKLKESEEKYRELYEDAPNAYFSIRPDQTIIRCNKAVVKILGYSIEEFLRRKVFALYYHSENGISKAKTLFQRFLNGEDIQDEELQMRHKNGNPIWVSLTVKPVKNQKGQIIESRSMVIDISERKKVENKLKESKQLFERTFNTLKDGIFILNAENPPRILNCNQAVEEIFGYSMEKMQDQTTTFLHIDTSTLKEFQQELYPQIEKGGALLNLEFKMKKKDGTIFPSEHSVVPLHTEKNDRIGWISVVRDITDRKKAEQKLKESEEKYRTLFESSKDGIVFTTMEGKILDANQAYLDMLGYTIEEVRELSYQQLTPKKWHKMEEDIVKKQFLRRGYSDEYEKEYIRKDGTLFPMTLKGWSIRDERGNPKGMWGFIRDITVRKKTEQKLKESVEKFREIAEQSLIGIQILQDNRTEYINQQWAKISGFSVEEIMKWNLEDHLKFIHPDNREFIKQQLIKKQEGGKDVINRYQTRCVKKTGETIWVEVFAKTINFENKPADFISIIDITDKKLAEEKLKESEGKYRNLVETSSMGLMEIDVRKEGVIFINPRLLEIVGYTQEELLSKGIFYKAIYPEDYKKMTKSDEEKDIEFRIINKEGKIKWLSGRTLHHYNEQGKLNFVRLWLQDITERKELEEIKSNLLTRISHEIKTPLISIKGFTDLLLSEYAENLDDKILSFLERIKDGGNRLKSLINTFLESTQLDKEYVVLNLNQENLSLLIRSSLEKMEGVINMREHTVDLNIHDDLTTIFDKERIESVFTNLLINAIYYTPKRGNISIQSNIKGKFIIISVKDNGIGLSKKEISQLFKPFGKIERFGKRWDIISEGMGLGLNISKEIIDLHRGKIWVESEGINKGSIFSFSLPIDKNKVLS